MTAAIAPNKIGKLMRKWGFEEVRTSGGHTIWRAPSGGSTSTSCTRISDVQVKNAAHLVGVNSYTFMQGPKRGNK
jgi:predicted RNA binding protein YcfA (HicA-like mRNA interferase family)